MEWIICIMLISGGLFTGVAFTLAWDRLPAWKQMSFSAFRPDFTRTLRVADKLQPGLLVLAIIASAIFTYNTEQAPRTLALTATAGYLIIMLVSAAVLVPLQLKIRALQAPSPPMLHTWSKGHVGRTALALLSFGLSAGAVALYAA